MSLRTFMFAADALRLEEGVSFHVETEGRSFAPVPSPDDMRARNAQSMAALQGMLGGVKNAPGKRRG